MYCHCTYLPRSSFPQFNFEMTKKLNFMKINEQREYWIANPDVVKFGTETYCREIFQTWFVIARGVIFIYKVWGRYEIFIIFLFFFLKRGNLTNWGKVLAWFKFIINSLKIKLSMIRFWRDFLNDVIPKRKKEEW